jgi:hypothetical protein
MKTILMLAGCVFLLGCQKASEPKPVVDEPAFRKPSPTEVFNLRSKCVELGEKILNGNVIGSALAQEQVSHYDPKTNRCYISLTVHMADLTKYEDYYSRSLYDGQTGEMLGFAGSKKGVKSGDFFDGSSAPDFEAATKRMEALMADDRKQ